MKPLAASLLGAAAIAFPAPGLASQLIDRNASDVTIRVSSKGVALLTYRARGALEQVLAWRAVNAVAPSPNGRQVAFRLRYVDGGGARVHDACRPYTGPPLAWVVTACTAPDGSHWAVQSWQRGLPPYGEEPTPSQAAWELRLSHWRGALPSLSISLDWAYRRYDHLFGRFVYRGRSVFGFRHTPTGAPLDDFGRNVYVDTYDSAYGARWRRENAFLTHRATGAFCYGFFTHGGHPSGKGSLYRATISGPGVTPDVMWQATAPGAYVATHDAVANARIRALHDPRCRPN